MVKVLFVCLGNICRSPTAEGIFTKLIEEHNLSEHFEIDSAGTDSYHVGCEPDPRAQHEARLNGIEISHLRARQVKKQDFEYYDYILAMDNSNLNDLHSIFSQQNPSKVRLLLSFLADNENQEVPDPYYRAQDGFSRVYDLIQAASEAFLQELKDKQMLK